MSRPKTGQFVRIATDYADHPSIASLSDAAFRAHAEMIIHCRRLKTGVVDLSLWSDEQIEELSQRGLLSGVNLVNLHHFPRGGHDGRPRIPTALRRRIYERDGHACVFCGATKRLSLDHIKRYRDGGLDTEANLRVLCLPCNQRRG